MRKCLRKATFEMLEPRQMMSGTPLSVATQAMPGGGTALVVTGTINADQITFSRSSDGLVIGNTGGWTTTVAGSFRSVVVNAGGGNDSVIANDSVTDSLVINGGYGDDTLTGGSGNDRIYGGMGKSVVNGGAGNDILVTIGGSPGDSVYGGAGRDSFWTDSSAGEKVYDMTDDEKPNAHRIYTFSGIGGVNVSKDLVGQAIADPKATSTSFAYRNFKANALFADSGPVSADINQGQVGDCYFLSTMSSIARVNQNKIQQSVVDLGDGTYGVAFKKGTTDYFIRVDADLPSYSPTAPAYAGLGTQSSLWAAVMEKAYAVYKTAAGSYAGISGGWMSSVYSALGVTNSNIYSSNSATTLANLMKQGLDQGKSVTLGIGTPKDGIACVGSHAYDVVSMQTDGNGAVVSIRLRNPWGVDGAGNDGVNDGYVTVTPAQVLSSFLGVTIGTV